MNNSKLLYILGLDSSFGINGKNGIAQTVRNNNEPIIKSDNSNIGLIIKVLSRPLPVAFKLAALGS